MKLKSFKKHASKPNGSSENTKGPANFSVILAGIFGIFSIFLGIAVMTGWYLKLPVMVQIHADWVPMQFNTAMGFLLAGAGLLCTLRKPGLPGILFGVATALLGFLTLIEYLWGIDLGIDQLLMEAYLTVKTSHPGRMAPNTALGYVLVGAALTLINLKHFPVKNFWIPGVLSAIALLLGVLALIGYATSVDTAYGWGQNMQMAVHTALGFAGLGLGIVLWVHYSLKKWGKAECCPPIALSLLGILFSGCLWMALISHEEEKKIEEINLKADHYIKILESRLGDQANALVRMAHRWNASSRQEPELWRNDAANYMAHFQAYDAIGWADSRHKVKWVVSEKNPKFMKDQSLVEDPTVKLALEKALEEKSIQFSKTLNWDIENKILLGIIPLFKKGNFYGTLVAVFHVADLLKMVTDQEEIQNYPVTLFENQKLLMKTGKGKFAAGFRPDDEFITQDKWLRFKGLEWKLQFHIPDYLIVQKGFHLPEIVLAVGLFFSVMNGLVFHLLRKGENHRKSLESEIIQRQKVERDLARAQKISRLGNWTLQLPDLSMSWSQEALRILGYRSAKGVSSFTDFLKAVHPEDRERVSSEIQASLKDGAVFNCTHRVIQLNGVERMVKHQSEIYLGANGRTERILGTVQDITDQKEAENMAARIGRIVDKSFNEIYIFDVETMKFSQVNLGARLNLRYSMKELAKMTPLDLKPEFTLEKFEKLITPLKQGKESVIVFETVHKRKNGTTYPVEIRLQLSKQEVPPQFVAIVQDITERKKAEDLFSKAYLTLEKRVQERTFDLARLNKDLHLEISERKNALEALEKSEKSLEAIMDNVIDGIVTIDEKGIIYSFNSSAERLFGYPIEEVVGKNVNILMPEPDKSQHDGYLSKLVNSGRSAILGMRRVVTARKKDGTVFSAELAVSEAVVGDKRMFTGLVRDLTEKEEVERELVQARKARDDLLNRYHLILEAAGEGVYGVDTEGRTTFVNPAAEKMLGYSSKELIGIALHSLVHNFRTDGSYYDETECPIYSAFKDGQIRHVSDELFWRKDGTSFPVEYYSTPIRESGQLVGAVVTFKDITARKETEKELIIAKDEAEKANRAKSQFLSQMSHELRTPLNAILGFSQLMETNPMEPLTDAQSQGVGEILKAGRHLLDLINEILDMARIEAGNLSLSIEDINLNDLVEELLTLSLPLAKGKNIDLYNYVSLEGDIYVRADRVRLKQVLLNLMSNAIKYNNPNGSVKLDAVEKEDGTVEVSVSDTGVGISQERMGELFQPFNRLGTEHSEIEGTGIGLTISKQLVECMDGSIRVTSKPAEGSVFALALPKGTQELASEDLFLSPVPKSSEIKAQSNKQIILYVEDNPANLNLVRHLFRRRAEIELLAAPDAKLGIELAKAHKPDLILMDINLPGMDGTTAMKYLRQSPDTQDIPVIAVSANALPRDIKQGLMAGFVDYLTKPLDVAEFHRVVSEVLNNKEARQPTSQ